MDLYTRTFIHLILYFHTIRLKDSFHIFIFFCFIHLLLPFHNFHNFPSNYMVLVWGRREARLKLFSRNRLPQKLTQVVVEFCSFHQNIVYALYTCSANNFREIISKRPFVKRSHKGHSKHLRKGEMPNFPRQSNHRGLPTLVNPTNHS